MRSGCRSDAGGRAADDGQHHRAGSSTHQGAAVPGVTVTAKNAATGFTRTEVSDGEGIYRLTALPVGTYDLTAGAAGLRARSRARASWSTSARRSTLDFDAEGRERRRDVTVTGGTPLIETTVVVGRRRRRHRAASRACRSTAGSSPTSRRRFPASASASTPTRPRARSTRRRSTAATAATSTTRSTAATTTTTRSAACCSSSRSRRSRSSTSSPQRYKAEYGRSNGGVMNIVTKSGTNDFARQLLRRSFRDTSMNAKTETEKLDEHRQAGLPPLPVRRQRSAARSSRTRRTSSPPSSGRSRTRRRRSTRWGCSRAQDGVFADAVPREPVHRQGDGQPERRRSTCRCATAATQNSQPYGATPQPRVRQLGRQREHVQLDQPEPQLGARRQRS